jgi:hypothetical protein
MGRIRLMLLGAVIGLTWAASLRGFMMALAGPDSTFTFTGTFGIIIPTGIVVGALLGWAEHQRRTGPQHRLLILAPLLVGIAPLIQPGAIGALFTTGDGGGPIGLAVLAMIGGYSVSGRGPLWARIVAGIIALADIPVTFFAPKPYPDLSYTTAHGAWFATLASSLFVTLALACSIPMRRPEASPNPAGRTSTADTSDHRSTPPALAVPRRTPAETTGHRLRLERRDRPAPTQAARRRPADGAADCGSAGQLAWPASWPGRLRVSRSGIRG